jgi:plastocyanin
MRILGLSLTILTMSTLAACSDSTGNGGTGGRGNSITVSNNSFRPTPDTATAGVVTFTWTNASNSHNVSWLTGPGTLPANSGTMTTGTYAPTLQAGTYTYHCTVHQGMNGTIVVE